MDIASRLAAAVSSDSLSFIGQYALELESPPYTVPADVDAQLSANCSEPLSSTRPLLQSLRCLLRAVMDGKTSADDACGAVADHAVLHRIVRAAPVVGASRVAGSASAQGLSIVNWSVGVAVASSVCKVGPQPYVRLQLQHSTGAGEPDVRTVELTVPEFWSLASQLGQAAESLRAFSS